MSCRAIHWGTEAGRGWSSVWRWAAPPWGADIGAETWMRWGREPRRDLEEEVSGQKERKAKRFWGRNELGRFEEQQEGQCAWSRVVKQRVVGRGQTCLDGHRGPGGPGEGCSEWGLRSNVPLLVKHPGPPPSPHITSRNPHPMCHFCPHHQLTWSWYLFPYVVTLTCSSPNENVSFPRADTVCVVHATPRAPKRHAAGSQHTLVEWMCEITGRQRAEDAGVPDHLPSFLPFTHTYLTNTDCVRWVLSAGVVTVTKDRISQEATPLQKTTPFRNWFSTHLVSFSYSFKT